MSEVIGMILPHVQDKAGIRDFLWKSYHNYYENAPRQQAALTRFTKTLLPAYESKQELVFAFYMLQRWVMHTYDQYRTGKYKVHYREVNSPGDLLQKVIDKFNKFSSKFASFTDFFFKPFFVKLNKEYYGDWNRISPPEDEDDDYEYRPDHVPYTGTDEGIDTYRYARAQRVVVDYDDVTNTLLNPPFLGPGSAGGRKSHRRSHRKSGRRSARKSPRRSSRKSSRKSGRKSARKGSRRSRR